MVDGYPNAFKVTDIVPGSWNYHLDRNLDTHEIGYSKFAKLNDYYAFYGETDEENERKVLVMMQDEVITSLENDITAQRVWLSYEN